MTVKTITVTEDAYEALKSLKESDESFSKTILRVAAKKSLRDFVGVISKESAGRIEHAIKETRKENTVRHRKRMDRIVRELHQGV